MLKPDGLFWLSYPKKTSTIAADLSRVEGWDVLDAAGWRPVSQIAIDATWSALRFRPRDAVRSAKTPRPKQG